MENIKLRSEKTYYFAIPLLEIKIEQYGINIEKQYAFCSFYYPLKYQPLDDFLYLIKVYNYFSTDFKVGIDALDEQKLLFGESRYYPFIVTNGEMKWILIGEKSEYRSLDDFPDLKMSGLNARNNPSERNWFLLKNAGMNGQSWNKFKRSFDEVKNLEYGDELSEVLVKYRIYIEILKNKLIDRAVKPTLEEWKDILFDLVIKEPSAKRTKPEIIRNEFVESYTYDYVFGSD